MTAKRLVGKIVVTAHGGLLLGGHSAAPAFVDASTAQEERQDARHGEGRAQPQIPASALRGALREALVRRLGLVDSDVDAPGPGRPGRACTPWDPCPDGSPCPVCRIFGRAGPDRPGVLPEARSAASATGGDSTATSRDHSWFRLEDARRVEQHRLPSYQLRHGVSVDRRTGHAAKGRLFVREVAECADERFESPFEACLDAQEMELLKQAALLVDGLGNSRSRGLGTVSVRLEWTDQPEHLTSAAVAAEGGTAPPVRVDPAVGSRALVVLTAETDLHLGEPPDSGNVRSSTEVVPGSALLGALAWALVGQGAEQMAASAFHCLVHEVTFSDLLPWDGGAPELVGPLPRTALGCTRHRRQRFDEVIRAALIPRLLERLGGCPAHAPRCSECRQPLRPAGMGFVRVAEARNGESVTGPSWRLVTRLAIDPVSGSHARGMLHARQQLLAGARFIGTVANLTPEVATLLASCRGPVRIGALRSRGLGRVTLQLVPYDIEGLQRRLRRFAADAAALAGPAVLDVLGLASAGQWVEVVARSPLAPGPSPTAAGPDEAGAWLGRELFPPRLARLIGVFQRTGMRSGWEDRRWDGASAGRPGRVGPRPVEPVILPGSTWLYYVAGGTPLDLEPLAAAETAGVGRLRELGLGRLAFCPRLGLTAKRPDGERS